MARTKKKMDHVHTSHRFGKFGKWRKEEKRIRTGTLETQTERIEDGILLETGEY